MHAGLYARHDYVQSSFPDQQLAKGPTEDRTEVCIVLFRFGHVLPGDFRHQGKALEMFGRQRSYPDGQRGRSEDMFTTHGAATCGTHFELSSLPRDSSTHAMATEPGTDPVYVRQVVPIPILRRIITTLPA